MGRKRKTETVKDKPQETLAAYGIPIADDAETLPPAPVIPAKTPAKRGRKKIQIDQKAFEELCRLQCTRDDVCRFFGGIDYKTLNRWWKETYNGKTFEVVFAEKRTDGFVSLRRALFSQAERNPATAIFLAKNYLGMTDEHTLGVKRADDTSQRMDDFFAERKEAYKEARAIRDKGGESDGDSGTDP